MRNGHKGRKRESLKAGIAKVFTSFLMIGGSIAVYFLSLHKQVFIVDNVFLWIFIVVFFLFGLIIMVQGVMDIIYNLILFREKLSCENDARSKIL